MAHVKDEVLFGAEIKKRVREMAGEERMKPLRKGFDHINGVSGTKEMGVLVKDIRVGMSWSSTDKRESLSRCNRTMMKDVSY